jgi:membrane associated rhomboid family serine protease
MYAYMYVCMHVCMYVCMYIYFSPGGVDEVLSVGARVCVCGWVQAALMKLRSKRRHICEKALDLVCMYFSFFLFFFVCMCSFF